MSADKSQIITSGIPITHQDPVLDHSSATPSTASTVMQEHSSLLPSHKYTNSVPEREEVLDQEDQEGQTTHPKQPIQPENEEPEKKPEVMKKTALQAAAEDRQIALSVWKDNSDRDDEVRDALGRMLGWVERLMVLLHTSLQTQTELQTSLTLTQSNLALALSNTEMLEEALRRDASGRRADVGWSRSTPGSTSFSSSFTPATAPLPGTGTPPPKGETGFFKIFKSGTAGTPPGSARSHATHNSVGSGVHSHHSSVDNAAPSYRPLSQIMSPSLPSLHSEDGGIVGLSRRENELSQALQREKESTVKALREKQKLEEELESLSQALFEEANKMVANERRERAQIEEELENVRQQKEALKAALKIVENENATLRSGVSDELPLSSSNSSDGQQSLTSLLQTQAKNGQDQDQGKEQAQEQEHEVNQYSQTDKRRSVVSIKDRPRALTIDTDRAGGGSNQQAEATQGSASKSVQEKEDNKTPTSTTSPKVNAASNPINRPDFSSMPRGGISFA